MGLGYGQRLRVRARGRVRGRARVIGNIHAIVRILTDIDGY